MSLIAGDVAFDFVNTAKERDHLPSATPCTPSMTCASKGQRRGELIGGADGDTQAAELPDALADRALLCQLFLNRVHGQRSSDADRASLNRLASMAYQAARLDQEPDGHLDLRSGTARPPPGRASLRGPSGQEPRAGHKPARASTRPPPPAHRPARRTPNH
jgi:hypothetical protein